MELSYLIGSEARTVRAERSGDEVTVDIDGRTVTARVTRCADGRLSFLVEGRSVGGAYARTARGLEIWVEGESHLLTTPDVDSDTWGAGGGADTTDGRVLTPMPGKVVAVNVAAGDRVEGGQALVVLESMKMQNDILAPAAGTVSRVHHDVGDNVEYGDVLVELDLEDAAGD